MDIGRMNDCVRLLSPRLYDTIALAGPAQQVLADIPCSARVRLSDAAREQGVYTEHELTVHCFPVEAVTAGCELEHRGLRYEVAEVVELAPTLQRIMARRYRA